MKVKLKGRDVAEFDDESQTVSERLTLILGVDSISQSGYQKEGELREESNPHHLKNIIKKSHKMYMKKQSEENRSQNVNPFSVFFKSGC